MANGDDAAAVGMDVVPGTADLRQGYDEDNKTRDYLAQHQTGGTHDASAIVSGIFDAARIPSLPASQIGSGTFDVARLPTIPGSKISGYVAAASGADTAARAFGSDGPHSATAGAGPSYAVWVDGTHNFVRNTSSKRYKRNIRDLPVTIAQLAALRPRIFDRKAGISNEPGFIAEEVNEVWPEPVVLFWELDDDGKQIGERVIDGLRLDLMGALGVAALAKAVVELTARVDELEKGNS